MEMFGAVIRVVTKGIGSLMGADGFQREKRGRIG